jgi:ketosteroid isomerase-like protein
VSRGQFGPASQPARPERDEAEAAIERSLFGFSGSRYLSAMSEESVAVARGMLEAVVRGDFAAAEAAFDPEVEWDGRNLPDGEVARGIGAVRDHMVRWRAMWETWELELEDVIDAGEDRAIAFFRERGRSKAGLEVNERHSELYRVREGKIIYRKGFSDADQALVEAGLR